MFTEIPTEITYASVRDEKLFHNEKLQDLEAKIGILSCHACDNIYSNYFKPDFNWNSNVIILAASLELQNITIDYLYTWVKTYVHFT